MARRRPGEENLPRGINVIQHSDGRHYGARASYLGKQYWIGTYWTLADAKAALAIARSEMARGTFVPPAERRRLAKTAAEAELRSTLSVATWADAWLEGLKLADRSPGTVASYASTLRVHVLPTLGEMRLVEVTRGDIDDMLAAARRAKAPWANVARTVRALFAAAVDANAGGLTVSPVRVTVPKPPRARTLAGDEVPTDDEVDELRRAMPDELAAAVDLAAWCALRLGEVLGLQRRDLEGLDDPTTAVVHVRRQWLTKASPPGYGPPKRGSERTVAVPPSLVPALRAHLLAHAGPGREGPVFPSPRDKTRPISEQAFNRAWARAKEAASVEYRFHDLRHAGLTAAARAGATAAELMARGGHTDPAAAARYQHASLSRDRELAAKLGPKPKATSAR